MKNLIAHWLGLSECKEQIEELAQNLETLRESYAKDTAILYGLVKNLSDTLEAFRPALSSIEDFAGIAKSDIASLRDILNDRVSSLHNRLDTIEDRIEKAHKDHAKGVDTFINLKIKEITSLIDEVNNGKDYNGRDKRISPKTPSQVTKSGERVRKSKNNS